MPCRNALGIGDLGIGTWPPSALFVGARTPYNPGMIHAAWNILLELSPWLLLGAAIAGAIHVLLPKDWMKRHLTGRLGVLKSVLVGIPLPLCSCSVIPVGLGIRRDGASDGAAVGFLISTPQTGVDSILVSGSMLGWPFAAFKVLAALVMGLVGGTVTDAVPSSLDEGNRDMDSAESHAHGTAGTRAAAAVGHAVELIRSIWKWLVAGVLISALITWLVPPNSLNSLPGMTGFTALLVTLVVSLPLYVCATASVPIAAALVAGGLSPGAAMVFLMAGPATNVATVGAVYRTLGLRALAIYMATMIGGSLVAGFLFDSVLPTATASIHEHGPHSGWLATLTTVVLLGLCGWFLYQDLRRWQTGRSVRHADLTLHVSGLVCENCAAGLEDALRSVEGIDAARVSFQAEEVQIFGSASPENVTEAITRKGYQSHAAR